ncbi:MAG: aminotransferase class I/II-fold pyridoxal phosphate-dependent enzyme [Chitinophagaceae bacterium]|nr:aminotransferase class I/II-fold pyridoxal phosphate-dependent enzyme [Chitinophagaceae bacterium]
MIDVANRLKQVEEYYFSKKLREIEELNQSGPRVINLGIGSPDLPPHPDVVQVLHEESARHNTHAYQSYKGAPALRKAMAEWYSRWYGVLLNPETELLPLIGSKEGITHICMTYLNEGDSALVPDPGYPAYSSAVKVAGATAIPFALKEANSYFPDLKELTKLVQENNNVKLLFVNYPNMPTGQLPTRAMFDSLVEWAFNHKILIIHDNPYSFILNDQPMSILASPGAMEVALELNSLSKSHNLAGWRVGMLAGKAERLQEVLRFKSNLDSGMFLPVQLAAAKALSLPESWYAEVNNVYRERRELAFKILDIIGCNYSKTQAGMFVWASVPVSYEDGFAVTDEVLTTARVFITPGGIFGENGKDFIRISLCSPKEVFSEAIERISSQNKK